MIGREALRLAGIGWHVFPCLQDKKQPATKAGLLEATNEAARVEAWWTKSPACNLAVATGDLSGFFVLDVDAGENHNGVDGFATLQDLERRFGALPETVASVTASGGLHLFFLMPPGVDLRNSAGKLGAGLDTRANGGYVVLPPSTVDGGSRGYVWEVDPEEQTLAAAPEWLIEKLMAPVDGPVGVERFELPPVVQQGGRNDVLFRYASSLRAKGASEPEILTRLLEANRSVVSPPLSEREINTIAKSVSRYPEGRIQRPSQTCRKLHSVENAGVSEPPAPMEPSEDQKPEKSPQIAQPQPDGRMPGSRELEAALLGCIMLDRETLPEIIALVEPEDFHLAGYGAAFRELTYLFMTGKSISAATLTDRLRETGNLRLAGGADHIQELEFRAPRSTDATDIADKIRAHANRRRFIRSLDTISSDARGGAPLDDLCQRAMDAALAPLASGSGIGWRLAGSYIDEVRRSIAEREEARKKASSQDGNDGSPRFYIPEVDKIVGVWPRTAMAVLAARPGVGKTAMALQLANRLTGMCGKPVAIVQLEMDGAQVCERLLLAGADVEVSKVSQGFISQSDRSMIRSYVNKFSGQPIYVSDDPGLTFPKFAARCRQLKAQVPGLGMIILDYLQLLTMGGKYRRSRQEEVSEISRGVKLTAKEIEVPILACCQLSRDHEKRNEEPRLSDLRESGAIEQDADLIAFLHRSGDQSKGNMTPIKFLIAKNRHGATGNVDLLFDGPHQRFSTP